MPQGTIPVGQEIKSKQLLPSLTYASSSLFYLQGGNINASDAPPASTAEDISESKVTWQDQVILFTILAGGASDPFMLPPCMPPLKREYNAVSAIAGEIWQYRTGGNLTILDKDHDTAEEGRSQVRQKQSSCSQAYGFATITMYSWWRGRMRVALERGKVAKALVVSEPIAIFYPGMENPNCRRYYWPATATTALLLPYYYPTTTLLLPYYRRYCHTVPARV